MMLSSRSDSLAFAELYDQTAGRVFGLVLMITRDVATSVEVTEAVYAHVWQHSARFDPRRGSAVGWILSAARRLATDTITPQPAAAILPGGVPGAAAGSLMVPTVALGLLP